MASFQFVMLMPKRITLRASKRREAVLRLPKALGFPEMRAAEKGARRQSAVATRRGPAGGFGGHRPPLQGRRFPFVGSPFSVCVGRVRMRNTKITCTIGPSIESSEM